TSGGLGFGLAELAVVAEESGRVLFGGPFLASAVVATAALSACDGPVARAAAGELASGAVVATAVIPAIGLDVGEVRGSVDGDVISLRGRVPFAVGGTSAAMFVVATRLDDELALVVVRSADREAVRVSPLEVLDASRDVSQLEFRDAPASVLAR